MESCSNYIGTLNSVNSSLQFLLLLKNNTEPVVLGTRKAITAVISPKPKPVCRSHAPVLNTNWRHSFNSTSTHIGKLSVTFKEKLSTGGCFFQKQKLVNWSSQIYLIEKMLFNPQINSIMCYQCCMSFVCYFM